MGGRGWEELLAARATRGVSQKVYLQSGPDLYPFAEISSLFILRNGGSAHHVLSRQDEKTKL